jgi:hypothetical protein
MRIFLKQVIFCFLIYGTKMFSEAAGIDVAQELETYEATNGGVEEFRMADYNFGGIGSYAAEGGISVQVTKVEGSCEVDPKTQWVQATVTSTSGNRRLNVLGSFFGPIMYFPPHGWIFCPLSPTFWWHFWPYPRRFFIRAMRVCLFNYFYGHGNFALFMICVRAAINGWYPWILSGARRLEVEADVCGGK